MSFSKASKTSCRCSGSSGISKLSIFSHAASSPCISHLTTKGAATAHISANSVKGISSHLHCCPEVSKHSPMIFPNLIASSLCSSVNLLSSFLCQSGASSSVRQTREYSTGSNEESCSQSSLIFELISAAVIIPSSLSNLSAISLYFSSAL